MEWGCPVRKNQNRPRDIAMNILPFGSKTVTLAFRTACTPIRWNAGAVRDSFRRGRIVTPAISCDDGNSLEVTG
jgi:hypothetical protein